MKFILPLILFTSAYAGTITSKSLSIDPSVASDIKPTKIPVKKSSKFKLSGTCTYAGVTYKSGDDGYQKCIATSSKGSDKSFKSSTKDGATKKASFTFGSKDQ